MTDLRTALSRRPWWMQLLLGFCLFMTLVYMPFDLFLKPVAEDQEVWFGFMLTGWAAKAMILKYGGVPLYRRLRPFFLGMICGDLFMRAVWALVAGFGTPGGGFRF